MPLHNKSWQKSLADLLRARLSPGACHSSDSQALLPTGVLVLGLELQRQYVARLQRAAMARHCLKEHAQRCEMVQGAQLPAGRPTHTNFYLTGQSGFVVAGEAWPGCS